MSLDVFLPSSPDVFLQCKTPPEIGELVSIPNAGCFIHCLIHNFPKLQYVKLSTLILLAQDLHCRLQAQVQPITCTLLCIDLSIIPDFRWDEKIHGRAETFIILVEDVDGKVILFHDSFILC